MLQHVNKFLFILTGVFILLSPFKANAGKEPVLRLYKTGESLRVDSMLVVTDEQYPSGLGNYHLYKAQNYVCLEINHDQVEDCGEDSFTFRIKVEIKSYDENTSYTTEEKWLEINYRPLLGAKYKESHCFPFEGKYKVEVKILEVSDTLLAPFVKLSSEIWIERYKDMSLTTPPSMQSINLITNTNELEIVWDALAGAEEYHLEWTHVDDHKPEGGFYTSSELETDFLNNSSRVILASNVLSYRISNVFDRGYVVFRVRGIGRTGSRFQFPVYGAWSAGDVTAVNSSSFDDARYFIDDADVHETDLNWQYMAVFAEQGKKKETVNYFDGILRSRQIITRLNTDETSLAGETFYDYQGRAAIQVLPAPTFENKLKYFADFNIHKTHGRHLYPWDFDEDEEINNKCGVENFQLDTSNGASRYYSANNLNIVSETGPSFHQYIPEAFGYPYIRTDFLDDNTGRVRRQGGVGIDHQLNTGHETQFFYGTPDQSALDMLFGNAVGFHRYYFKEMVIDPNGQVAVSYKDLSGKVIATSLGGNSADSVESLSSSGSPKTVKEMYTPDSMGVEFGKDYIRFSKDILVAADNTNYDIYQAFVTESYSDGCLPEGVCFDCIYDLYLSLVDECGEQLLDGDPIAEGNQPVRRTVGFLDVYDTICREDGIYYSFNNDAVFNGEISVLLDKGKYQLVKTFQVNKDAVNYYTEKYLQLSTCMPGAEFLAHIMPYKCDMSAEDCIEELGTLQEFTDRFHTYVDTVWLNDTDYFYPSAQFIEDLYNKSIEKCNEIGASKNECKTMLQFMEFEVGPYGGLQDLNGDVTQHPEYCFYENCMLTLQGRRYDEKLMSVETYAEAKSRGLINGLNHDPHDFPRGEYDTFIVNNQGYHDYMDSSLNKAMHKSYIVGYSMFPPFNALYEGDTFSAWQIPVITYLCKDAEDIEDIETCLTNYNFSDEDQCKPYADLMWKLYRSIYIEKKMRLYDSLRIEGGCYPSADERIKFGQATFTDVDSLMDKAKNANEQSEEVRGKLAANCGRTCEVVATKWMTKLENCVFVTQQKKDSLYDGLYRVCKNGCNIYNPLGGIRALPPYRDTAYYKDVKDVLVKLNIFDLINCNDLLLDFPVTAKDGESQTWKGIFPELDTTCWCIRDSMYSHYKLDTCVKDIANEEVKSGLEQIAALQSDSICPSCVNCIQLYDIVQAFEDSFGVLNYNDYNPSVMLQTWINRELGFNLLEEDYIEFMRECAGLEDEWADSVVVSEFIKIVGSSQIANYEPVWAESGTWQNRRFEYQVPVYNEESHILKLAHRDGNESFRMWLEQNMAAPMSSNDYSLDTCLCNELFALNAAYELIQPPTGTFGDYLESVNFCEPNEDLLDSIFNHFCKPIYESEVGAHNGIWGEDRLAMFEKMKGMYPALDSLNSDIDTCSNCSSGGGTSQPPSGFICDSIWRYLYHSQSTEEDWGKEFSEMRDQFGVEAALWDFATKFAEKFPEFKQNYMSDEDYKNYIRLLILDGCSGGGSGIPNGGNWGDGVPDDFRRIRDSIVQELPNGSGCNGPYGPDCEPCAVEVNLTNLNKIKDFLNKMTDTIPGRKVTYFGSSGWTVDPSITDFRIYGLTTPSNTIATLTKVYSSFALDINFDDGSGYEFDLRLSFPNLHMLNFYGAITRILAVAPYRFNRCYSSEHLFDIWAERQMPNGALDTVKLKGYTTNLSFSQEGFCFPEISLCDRSPLLKVPDPCERQKAEIEGYFASLLTDMYRDSVREAFREKYIAKCMSAWKRDTLTIEYDLNHYQYTLYHYDQAGNLIGTVPPKGVELRTSQNHYDSVRNARKGIGVPVFMTHGLRTKYEYNTLNQLVWQSTPDGGESRFWYDRLGRITASQNAVQADDTLYSYTLYDPLGRVKEVGQLYQDDDMTWAKAFDTSQLKMWLSQGVKEQIVRTYYDEAEFAIDYNGFAQENLRQRVTSSTYQKLDGAEYDHGVHYTYDIHGNVHTLVRENAWLHGYAQGFKMIEYEYDLVSGNVNRVIYQRDSVDMFLHRYSYDADNRLLTAESSPNGYHWDEDARYFYYLHGPLARMETGELKVQGSDYAYTIHGWLKGVNSTSLTATRDMGRDAAQGSVNALVCKDVYGYSLRYYAGDYQAVSNLAAADRFDMVQEGTPFAAPSLYNGNITGMVTAISKFMEGSEGPLGKTYHYDQLNRLVKSRTWKGADKANNTWAGAAESGDYRTTYSYDANGNILNLNRHGASAVNLDMDSLEYHYYPNTNRLKYVTDHVNSGNYSNDVDNQSDGNYWYDKIGNLTKDVAEEIDTILWNVYGKIDAVIRITESQKPSLYFEYSPEGYRTVKTVVDGSGVITRTFYVRDAMGNVMATYEVAADKTLDTAELSWEELNSRLVNLGGLELFADFMADHLDMQTAVPDILDELETAIGNQNKETEFLYWFDPEDLLVNNTTYFEQVRDQMSDADFWDAMVANSPSTASLVSDLCSHDPAGFIENCYNQDNFYYLQAMWDHDPAEFDMLYAAFTSPPPPGAPPPPLPTAPLNDRINWLVNNILSGNIASQVNSQGGCTLNDDVLVEFLNYSATYSSLVMAWSEMRAAATSVFGQATLSGWMVSHNPALVWDILIAQNGASGFISNYKTGQPGDFLKNALKTVTYSVGTGIMNQFGMSKVEYLNEIKDFYGTEFYNTLMANLLMDFYSLSSYYRLSEHHIYGSSRIGTREIKQKLFTIDSEGEIDERFENSETDLYFYRGFKRYEMVNHLGNVLVVISDKRTAVCDQELSVSYFEAEVLMATDYYSFGWEMRTWTSDSAEYGFGYQGSQKTDEMAGSGSHYTTYFRELDVRIITWWSVDPLSFHPLQTGKSPYSTMWGNPIHWNDISGGCPECDENIKKPTEGQTYTSSGGGEYKYDGGAWKRQDAPGKDVTVNGGKVMTDAEKAEYDSKHNKNQGSSSSTKSSINSLWNSTLMRAYIPDFISIGVGYDLIYNVGEGKSIDFNWVTRGPEASFLPVITITQKAGGGYDLSGTLNFGGVNYLGDVKDIRRRMLETNFANGEFTMWTHAGIAAGGKVGVTGTLTQNENGKYLIGRHLNIGIGAPFGIVPVNVSAGVSNTFILYDFKRK
jgi:hypothetical protein